MKRLSLFAAVLVAASLLAASCSKKEEAAPAAGMKPGAKQPALAAGAGASADAIHASIAKGVAYLATQQNANGSWGPKDGDVGITGLALAALAQAPKDIRETSQTAIDKAVAYILAHRRADGALVNADNMLANYRTSIAARALIALDPEKYKDVIDASVKYTKSIQGTDTDNLKTYGSMGYGSDPSRGDQINTGEALELLAKAGVSQDDPVFERALVFLGRTQNLDEYAEVGAKTTNDGGAIYRADRGAENASQAGFIELPDGTKVPKSYGSATYSLLKSFLFAGLKKDNPRVQAALKWLQDHYTVKENPGMNRQGLYYYYYTMARTLELWGSPTIQAGGVEHNWAKELAAQVISLQKDDGSWMNEQDRWWEGDPALVTSYTLAVLEICDKMQSK